MFKKLALFLSVLGSFGLASAASAADRYDIDLVHSSMGFGVKHLTVSTVMGSFNDYTGYVEFDPNDPASFKSEVTIQANSIDTNNDKRDEHLRGADFFDVEKFPTITFTSKKLEKNGDTYVLTGDLTMKGVTKEISIPVGIIGPVNSPMGDTVIGLAGSTVINRQDFGVNWNKSLDNGGLMVDNDVKITIEIEAHKK